MAAAVFRLQLALAVTSLLVFSHLIILLNAVPQVTRGGGGGGTIQLSENSYIDIQVTSEMKNNGRMAVEINDYPGSGANNRHTPRTQVPGRSGCVDC